MDKYPNDQPDSEEKYADEVRAVVDGFIQKAEELHKSFSAAGEGQGDLVYQDHRLFVTPRDKSYEQYARIMQGAGLPHIVADPELSTEQVVVGKIPRDARVIPQIIRSMPSREGATPRDVFLVLGQHLGAMATSSQTLPDAHAFHIDRVLALRNEVDVLLPPPVSFCEASSESVEAIVETVNDQLRDQHAAISDLRDSRVQGMGGVYG